MSESITPSGTTRTAFSVSTNDLEISGDVTAGKFIGSGESITNLNVDSINRGNALSKSYGGTNNNSYIHQGIVFNNNDDDKFETSEQIRWDNQANILYINGKNIVQDSSNYVKTTSNILLNKIESKIENSSNVIILDILTHIQDTLKIDNEKGIPIASDENPGIVKVGEGLFMYSDGFLSINPENIQNITPTVIPSIKLQDLEQSLVKSIYKKYIFTYDPNLGTTFDYDESIEGIGIILPIWYNFSEIVNISDDIKYIKNKGNTTASSSVSSSDNLILHGPAVLKPDESKNLKYEYTPLNNNYLDLDGVDGTYAEISDKCDIQKIYNIGGLGGYDVGITFAFWFKCSDPEKSKSFMFLHSDDLSHYINIGIDDSNNLTFNIFNSGTNEYKVTQSQNLFDGKWVHLCWTINGNGKWLIYINNVKENDITITRNIDPKAIYIKKYIGRSRNYTNNTLKCSISDFRIYNKVLNDIQIKQLFNANKYTEYVLTYHEQENSIITDVIMIGGGGGGNLDGGGGAGKLIYINNANIFSGDYSIKIGRGGAGNYTTQNNKSGNDTSFHTLIAKGGGSHDYNSGIGGSGSGNGGTITDRGTITDNSSYPFLNTDDIYLKGNDGYTSFGGGDGAGSAGLNINGGDGVYEINNADLIVNFKDNFDLPTDNSIGYYNSTNNQLYLAGGGSSNINGGKGGLGGGGDGSTTFDGSLMYHGIYGSGGGGYSNVGASGGDGIIILRFIDLLIKSIKIPDSVLDTSNYVSQTSNLVSENLNTAISDTRNYVLQTSNLISSNLNTAISDTSNYVLQTSNLVSSNLNTAISDTSNYVASLSADEITDGINNKFIINGIYSNDLEVYGDITASNLTIHGITSTLNTDVYVTEQLDVQNSGFGVALKVEQNDNTSDIINLHNATKQVLNVNNQGNVGIGTTFPEEKLHVFGNILATGYIKSFFSDERLKTDIELIPDPLNIIEQLNGFYYKPNKLANSFGIESNHRELGLSAQEVNKVLPEIVDLAPLDMMHDENNNIVSKSGENYLTLSYDKMIPVIIESIKKLNSEIKLLKEENKLLKESIKKNS